MTEIVNRTVLDLSHHNTIIDWNAIKNAGIFGIIHKATQGTGFVDDEYLPRAREALSRGLLWGAYHFGDGSDPQKQVDNFLKIVGVDDETLYALDWEENPNGADMDYDCALEFIERLEREIGVGRTVIYSGNVAKEQVPNDDSDFGARRLWLAQYGTNPTCNPCWDSYWLWQYSDGQVGPEPRGCPGVSGYVDTNSWPGTVEQLRAEWSGAGQIPAPKPTPQPEVVIAISAPPGVRIVLNGKEIEV